MWGHIFTPEVNAVRSEIYYCIGIMSLSEVEGYVSDTFYTCITRYYFQNPSSLRSLIRCVYVHISESSLISFYSIRCSHPSRNFFLFLARNRVLFDIGFPSCYYIYNITYVKLCSETRKMIHPSLYLSEFKCKFLFLSTIF